MGKSISIVTAMAASTLLAVAPAVADPSATVTKLMNTPTSLFSFGLYQVEQAMQDMASGLHDIDSGTFYGHANYKWANNRIYLRVDNMTVSEDKADGFEKRCAYVVGKVREYGMVRDGKPIIDGGSRFASLFWPVGYSVNSLPDDEMRNIDEMIEISYIEVTKDLQECTAPLLGTGYSIQKK